MQLQPIQKSLLPYKKGVNLSLDGRLIKNGQFIYDFNAGYASTVVSINDGVVFQTGFEAGYGHFIILKTELSPGVFAYDKYSGILDYSLTLKVGDSVKSGSTLGKQDNTLRLERFGNFNSATNRPDSYLQIDFAEVDENTIASRVTNFESNNNPTIITSPSNSAFAGVDKNDIVWLNENGAMVGWNNGRIEQSISLNWFSQNEEVLGKGQLYSNNFEQIVTRDKFTNMVKVYDGGNSSQGRQIFNIGSEWEFETILKSNSSPDRIVWRHKYNNSVNTTDFQGNQVVGGSYLGTLDQSWKFVAKIDADGNGIEGFQIENTNGLTAIWEDGLMSKAYITGRNSSTQDIVAGGDFNGDGRGDSIRLDRANMNYQILGGGNANNVLYNGYLWGGEQILGVADINNDGRADLLTRDSGNNVFASMAGQANDKQWLAQVGTEWDVVNEVN
jgi:hypothetical protein